MGIRLWDQEDKLKTEEEFKKEHPQLTEKFNEGDWVFGLGVHKGCSQVFWGAGVLQPFDYLNDYDPKNFRIATEQNKIDVGWEPPTEDREPA